MNALRIVSVGECTVDEYSAGKTECFGGISFNFAVNAKRCGADAVSLVSAAGEDHGPAIRQKLLNEKIDVSHFTIRPGKTARQRILLSDLGERVFPPGGYDPGVLTQLRLNADDESFINSHNVIAAACFQQVENLFDQAMRLPFHGWRVADFLDLSDFNDRPDIVGAYCDRLTIAFVSGKNAIVDQLQQLSRETECLFVVTLGAEGSVALAKGERIHERAISVDRKVDSTGCGDAFQAAFTVSYWRDRNLRMALQCGTKQAATVLQHLGAID